MSFVFPFDHLHERPPRELRDLLGGKGANLAEMTSVLELPVPAGFTISTDASRAYLAGSSWPAGLDDEVRVAVGRLESVTGLRLGDSDDPLLLSVRSGAKHSMPGMMDTVLDLGLNDLTVVGLARQTGDERFALDSYRRFIQMFGKVVLGVPSAEFDERMAGARLLAGVDDDSEIGAHVLEGIVEEFKRVVERVTGEAFPQDPSDQLARAITAVFSSWDAPRARVYRDHEGIPHDLGTAVNVQVMVFGNRDDRSATGVGFTRDPATGEPGLYGDFLVQAQGEDVVAGSHRTRHLVELEAEFPAAHAELTRIFTLLEQHYRDMLDIEFTIEQDRLWILQTRTGKRTGAAALRLAVAMTTDPAIALTRREAVARVTAEHLDQILHDQFDDSAARDVLTRGLGASPGAAVGRACFSVAEALAAHARGEPVILVRTETSPDDVGGMQVSEGILTSRGGLVSHAAVVARGWGKPAVVGAEDLVVLESSFTVDGRVVDEGDYISIDGETGEVMLGQIALRAAQRPAELEVILSWADEIRDGRMAVLANADNAEDAAQARAHGAEGIGLCRTEHMFLGDRLPLVQRVILATDEGEEAEALAALFDAQRRDFAGILEAMDDLPVTVRLLDAPMHEFLPDRDELIRAEARGVLDEAGHELLAASEAWREANPMLGTRGVRLGVLRPQIYAMQVRALLRAVQDRRADGGRPVVAVMVPLVSTGAELAIVRASIEAEIAAAGGARDAHPVEIGAMVETPRAAILADQIAGLAEFISFGTNDLTQMTFGFSRDDVERRVVPRYIEQGLLAQNPFETIDVGGVGSLVATAAERARSANPGIKISVCGEHGGDPASIAFFLRSGLDAVSCSPFRVPVARLAIAQALIGVEQG